MPKCKAVTSKGTPCTRDAMNESIPYCWQHARMVLEELMWGLDKVRDHWGEIDADDLSPEEVIQRFIQTVAEVEELREEVEQLIIENRELARLLEGCEDLLGDTYLPEDEEDSSDDPGWFPPAPAIDVQPTSPLVCPEVMTEEELFSFEPPGSAGMLLCLEEDAAEYSGDYLKMARHINGEWATCVEPMSEINILKQYFTDHPEDAFTSSAGHSWVKSGDWFFFKNPEDGKWYGNVIMDATFSHDGMDYRAYLQFVEDWRHPNLGAGAEFVIIIFS